MGNSEAKPSSSSGVSPPSLMVGFGSGPRASPTAASDAAAPPSPMNPMVGFGAKPDASPTASDGAAPPSLMNRMGGFGAKLRASPTTSDDAAPPSLMNPMGGFGAKPRASPTASDGAAPPSLVNPVSSSGGAKLRASDGTAPPNPTNPVGGSAVAKPRASSTAPSSSDGAATPSRKNPVGSSGTAETTNPDQYPRRPGVADCSYYVKFGTCAYGMKCWYHHPDPHTRATAAAGRQGQASNSNPSEHSNRRPDLRTRAAAAAAAAGRQSQASDPSKHNNEHPDLHSRGGGGAGGQSQASKPSEHNNKQHLSGKACNYNRHEGKNEVEQVQMNFLGLPLRPGAGLCSYYMHRGTCKFGTNCKFHHPDPKSEPVNSNASRRVVKKSSQLNFSSKPIQRAQNEQSLPLVTSPTSGTSKIIPTHGDSTCTEQSAYKVSSIHNGNISDRDGVLMVVKGILDDLTPEKFDLVKDQLIEAGITRDDILEDVITVMFEKAVSEPTFCPMYAQLCSYLNKKLPSSPQETDGKEISFTSVLLNNCHEVFEGAGNLCTEIDRLTGLDQEMETHNKEIMLMKLRTLGNIRLIGELLKQKIIIENIEHHTVQMDENKQGKTDWDTFATKVFCDICTDEVLAGNRPTDHLNAIGYNNLYAKFNEKTKKGYSHEQFKSKWESLKKDYQTWKALMESEDHQGQGPNMDAISASPEWWAKKMEVMPDCGKFRSTPLENVELLNTMFEDMLDSTSSTTSEASLAVSTTMESEHGDGDGNDTGIIDKEVDETMLEKHSNEEPNSTKSETSCVHAELIHPVNPDENVNPRNYATSTRADRVGSNISEVMELVVDAGVEEGSDEHFIATQLFVRPEYREMFLTLKTPRGRLGWLKKMCQVKE